MTDREYQQMYDEVHKELVTSEMRKKLALLTEHAADPTIEELTADRDRLAAECEHHIGELETLGKHATALAADVGRLTKERDAALREADRLRHGIAIESDFVCPDSLALTDALASIRALTADLAKYRAVVAENDAEIERMRGMPNLLRENEAAKAKEVSNG